MRRGLSLNHAVPAAQRGHRYISSPCRMVRASAFVVRQPQQSQFTWLILSLTRHKERRSAGRSLDMLHLRASASHEVTVSLNAGLCSASRANSIMRLLIFDAVFTCARAFIFILRFINNFSDPNMFKSPLLLKCASQKFFHIFALLVLLHCFDILEFEPPGGRLSGGRASFVKSVALR